MVAQKSKMGVNQITATLLLVLITSMAGASTAALSGELERLNVVASTSLQRFTEQFTLEASTLLTIEQERQLVAFGRNTGQAAIELVAVYFDERDLTATGQAFVNGVKLTGSNSFLVERGQRVTIHLDDIGPLRPGSAHSLKMITTNGAAFTFKVMAG